MQFFVILILIVFTSFPVISIDTKAKEAIVYDYNTQEVIFEKEADKLMIAKVTKYEDEIAELKKELQEVKEDNKILAKQIEDNR